MLSVINRTKEIFIDLDKKYPSLVLVIFSFILASQVIVFRVNYIILIILLLFILVYLQNKPNVFKLISIVLIIWIYLSFSLHKYYQSSLIYDFRHSYLENTNFEIVIDSIELNRVDERVIIEGEIIIGKNERINVYFSTRNEKFFNLVPGQVILLNTKGSVISPERIPNGFDEEEWLAKKGIYYRIQVNDNTNFRVLRTMNFGYRLTRKIHELRKYFTENLRKYSNVDTAGLIPAMLYGDTQYLSSDLEDRFQDLGLSHVLVASGSNVSLALSIIDMILKRFTKNGKIKIIFEILFLSFLSLLSLWDIAITRATIMKVIELIYKFNNKRSSKINYLLISILIMSIINPYNLLSMSMQLSFLSCLAVYSFQDIQFKRTYKKRQTKSISRRLIESLYLYLYIQIFIFPILFQMDAEFSLVMIVSNIFLVFLTEILLIWAFIFIFISPIGLLASVFASSLMGLASFILLTFEYIFKLFNLYISIENIFYFILIFIPWSKIYDINLSRLEKNVFIRIKFIAAILLIVIYGLIENNTYGVYFFDVGQGDSSLIKTKSDTVMIDLARTYEGRNVVSALEHLNIKTIDYLILTHLDEDHVGGLEALANSEIKIDNILLSKFASSEEDKYLNLMDILSIVELDNIYYLGAGDALYLDEIQMEFLGPILDSQNHNNDSLVFISRQFYTNILWTGDIDIATEHSYVVEYVAPNIDVIHASHHGSNDGTSEELLNWANPEFAVISAGFSNRYRHPSINVLERLEEGRVEVWRTDLNGTILMRADGKSAKLEYIFQSIYMPDFYDKIKLAVKGE